MTGHVFGDSTLLGWGKGINGLSKGWPIDCGIGRIVPFLGPIFGDGWLHDEIVDCRLWNQVCLLGQRYKDQPLSGNRGLV